MWLLPANQSLESVVIDLLGRWLKRKAGNLFMLVMTNRFTKLPKVVPLKRKTGLNVAKGFALHWVFKYAAPKVVLSENGLQFARKL